ncbi:MAG: hypothetical protein ACO1OB_25980, partial [Archangium sp.]
VTTPSLPTEPDPEWAGTFTNADSTLDVQTFGKTGAVPTEFQIRFFHEARPKPDKPTCLGDGAMAAKVELPCPTAADLERCPRRIGLEKVNGGFIVSFSGAGWTEQECTLQEIQPMPKPITVVRGDAFKNVVTPYVDELKDTDGDPKLLASLGKQPQITAAQLAQSLRGEFERQKLNPARQPVALVLLTLKKFHQLAYEACEGTLDGCDERKRTTALANAVGAYKQRADTLQAELDAK